MNKTVVQFLTTAACTAAAALLTVCAGIFAPFAMLFGLCASIFIAYLYITCGGVCAAVSAVVTSAATLVFGGGAADVLLVAAIGVIPGLVSGFMQKKNYDYYAYLGGVCLAFAAVMTGILFYANKTFPGGIAGMFDMTAQAMKDSAEPMLTMQGIAAAEDINSAIDSVFKQVRQTIPSMIIIFSMISGYIHIAAVEFFVRKISGIKINYVCFYEHSAPRHMVYVYFVALLVLLFGSGEGKLYTVLNNIVTVFDFILAFCGLSFIDSKFREKLKYGFVRGIIYVCVLMVASSFAMQLLSIMGMLDGMTDYRGIKRNGG